MTLKSRVRVVLADDHAMVRESLARVLEASGSVSVVGQAGDGLAVKQAVTESNPDCLVMDYSMPRHDPSEVIRELLTMYPRLKILVLTVHENVHYAVRIMQAGAHGYLIKSAAVDELVEAIDKLNAGDIYISKKIASDVWAQLRRPRSERDGLEILSRREFEVLRILGSGASLQECAAQLHVSVSTVSTYRSRILEKLNLSSTADLIRYAIENNVVV